MITIIIIWFQVAAFLYLVLGSCINFYVYGLRGEEIIPNVEFWKNLPSNIQVVSFSIWNFEQPILPLIIHVLKIINHYDFSRIWQCIFVADVDRQKLDMKKFRRKPFYYQRGSNIIKLKTAHKFFVQAKCIFLL